jgi:transposase
MEYVRAGCAHFPRGITIQPLRMLVRAGTTTQRVARRCRVILRAQEGMSNRAIAEQVGLSRPTGNATRASFLRGGLEAIQRDLGVDEKSQIQALDHTRPILPLRPGLPERQTHDSQRPGTTTWFAAFKIMTGKVIGRCWSRHRGKKFVKFLKQREQDVPADLDVPIILDNDSTHQSALVKTWRKPKKRRRFHFHFTPTRRSWLNQVEHWFGLITERMIRRGTFRSVPELKQPCPCGLSRGTTSPSLSYGGHRPMSSSIRSAATGKPLQNRRWDMRLL